MSGLLQDVRGRARDRVVAAKLANMDRENEKLRTETSMLRAQLQRTQADGEDLRDALRTSAKGRTVKVRKGSGPLRMLMLAGAAYVFGAKAGRQRYDDIVSWVRGQRQRLLGKADDVGKAIVDGTRGTIARTADAAAAAEPSTR